MPAIAAVALVGPVAATLAGVPWARRGASAGEIRVGAERQVAAAGQRIWEQPDFQGH